MLKNNAKFGKIFIPSLLDTHLLPKDVEEVFRRVQDSAHYMPNWQMEVGERVYVRMRAI